MKMSSAKNRTQVSCPSGQVMTTADQSTRDQDLFSSLHVHLSLLLVDSYTAVVIFFNGKGLMHTVFLYTW